ncbi:DUF2269 family protein [Streptomyces sp. NPDC048636]|uniref:DUF2269 family protein n=1 Tax=Streptomyces sp. NPDC048636 TaxID=3155762 RepID=UPI00341F31DE
MTKLFLSLHVLAAVVAIGPVTVAASMFPPALRRAHRDPGDRDALTTLRMLHRICRVYAAIGMAVPVFGFATASSLGVLGSGWLITSILLTAAAAAVLALLLLPTQDRELAALQDAAPSPATRAASHLAMLTGVFNLLWAAVTVLMIIRPGSTTGA